MSNNLYRATDLYLAGAIIARGFEIYRIEKQGEKLTFVFPESNSLSEFREDYFLHRGKIDDSLAMSIAIKNLKNFKYNHTK